MILLKILPISCNKGHKYCLSLPINVQEKEIRGEGRGKILIIIDSLRIRILTLYLFLTQDRDAGLCTINTWESLVIRQLRGQDFAWARPSIRKINGYPCALLQSFFMLTSLPFYCVVLFSHIFPCCWWLGEGQMVWSQKAYTLISSTPPLQGKLT